MGTLYADTGGNAANSGSTDNTSPLTGTTATATASTTVTLDAGTDLSTVVTSGATQSTINLAGTSVGNRTIFWISGTAGSLGATPTVTVDTAVTCAGVAWRIGGQYLWPSAATVNVMEGCLGLGDNSAPDKLIFNQAPATKTVTYLTSRVAGNSTKGKVYIVGKAGALRVLNVTNTSQVLTIGHGYWHVENIEGQQNGASGNCFGGASGSNIVYLNCKCSDSGAAGFVIANSGNVLMSESSGCLTSGVTLAGTGTVDYTLYGNYVHDNTGDGMLLQGTAPGGKVIGNIIDTNSGRGILLSGATAANAVPGLVVNNTVFGNLDSGLEITDADGQFFVYNNIFKDNGNAGTEYNWEQVAGTGERLGTHGYNCFNISGGIGGGNLLNVTADATDITTDPSFTNAAAGDFSLGSSSPCKATGYPGQFLGGNLGYMDMGAVQRQEAGGGAAGIMVGAGMTGGLRG